MTTSTWHRFTRLLVVALVSTVAVAAPRSAKDAYNDGLRAYEGQRFLEAAAAFESAYALAPRPLILFNIGQSYRKSGQFDRALASYRTYVAAATSSDPPATVSEARAYIIEIEQYLAAKSAPRPIAAPPPPVTAPPPPVVHAPVAAPVVALVEAKAPEPKKKRPLVKSPWLWTGVGVAVAAGIGIGLGVGLTRDKAPSTSLGNASPSYP